MELDVRLTRSGDESWGFRLIGGQDFKMPLTVVKVVSNSPAEKAGLENGDTVCRINDTDAQTLSHDSAKEVVDGAGNTLLMAVNRGLYDPVLDDYEPIYDPIDQEDFDQPSQPSEVDPFQIQQFIETKAQEDLPELRDIEIPSSLETRSLTASPFVLPTKPYRPFSTEPLVEVLPLEDPIILNPNYKDDFRNSEDRETLPETRFKLPISEQYDPDGTRRKADQITDSKCKNNRLTENVVKKETFEKRVKEESKEFTDMQHKTMIDEMHFMEKMKKEIDLDTIEMTAVNIVNESIQRAVAVADEIKEAIDIELSDSVAVSKLNESCETVSQCKKESKVLSSTKKTVKSEALEMLNMTKNATQDKSKNNEIKSEVVVGEKMEKLATFNAEKYESNEKAINKTKESSEREINSKKLEAFQEFNSKQTNKVSSVQKSEAKSATEEKLHSKTTHNKVSQSTKDSSNSSQQTKVKISNNAKTASKQRAYTIGLKTIPNIKGCIHSSYHYNLLLHTFFIHLTDVMVALSRFLLTQPIFDKEQNDIVINNTVDENKTTNNNEHILEERSEEHTELSAVVEEKIEEEIRERNTNDITVEVNQTEQINEVSEKNFENLVGKGNTEQYLELEESVEMRKLSGAKMAQVVDRKSEELTQRMDAVISEFQVKAGIEDTLDIRERRSRSRSRIEEEVALESDPLEWLSKEDKKKSVETTETKSHSFSSHSDYNESKITVNSYQKCEKKSKQTEGKQMYVAIVESHVFTNKDAIFDEQAAELSETFSVQSADEVNVATKACETIATEKVVLNSIEVKKEFARSIEDESNRLVVTNVESETFEIAKKTQTIVEEAREEKETIIENNLRNDMMINEIMDKSEETQDLAVLANNNVGEKTEITIEEYTATSSESFQEINNKVIIQQENAEETEFFQHEFSQNVLMESHESHSKHYELAEQVHTIVEEAQQQEVTAIAMVETKNDVIIQEVTEPVIETQEITTFTVNGAVQAVDIKVDDYTVATSEKVEIAEISESTNEIAIEYAKKEEKAVTFNEATKNSTEIEIKKPPKEEQSVEELTTELSIVAKMGPTLEEASAELKIVKEQILEIEQTLQLVDDSETIINKYSEISEMENQYSEFAKNSMQSYESKELIQESSFTANSLEDRKRLTLDLNAAKHGKYSRQSSIVSPISTIDTPTPSTIPPTPLTDEYVFKIKHSLPKSRGTTPAPMDPTPKERQAEHQDHEDPNIVKKKLVPHIDTTLDSPIIYDPPLPSPPLEKSVTPVYTKPGLRGGSDRPSHRKEEILEIERKSSLLASAIDETIKCIEEYKEEVGIKAMRVAEKTVNGENVDETNSNKAEMKIDNEYTNYNGFSNVATDGHDDNKMNDEWNRIDKQLRDSNEELNVLSQTAVNNVNKVGNEINVSESDLKISINNEITKTENFNSTNDMAIENNENFTQAVAVDASANIVNGVERKQDPLEGYRPVQFDPEELKAIRRNLQPVHLAVQAPMQREASPSYMDASGHLLGTNQGIVDGLDEPLVDTEIAKELGKPGITEDKIAELISGESEMLREAHVMGVDFKRIKPIIESLKDSEVLKALNDELIKTREEKKKEEEKKWTTFLQKPKRPVPRAKFGYYGYLDQEEEVENPYKVKIVKQPKPKVAPDYKSEDFETGPLPWEERALREPPPPPVDAEEPILVPEEVPEFLEAVDPLPESEVPDLEETGIPLPPPKSEEEQPAEEQQEAEEETTAEEQPEESIEAAVEETEKIAEEMEQNGLAEQLMSGVQNMVDPNASIEQQLAQMRAQVAALAQLPGVIQQTLNLVTQQLTQLSQQESHTTTIATFEAPEAQDSAPECEEEPKSNGVTIEECTDEAQPTINEEPTEPAEEAKPSLTQEEMEKLKKEEEEMLEEQKRIEKQKKELMDQMRLDQESRQVKQRPTPRVGKPKPVFGPPVPEARPLVLPGGRRWRKPEDAYNEQFIAETLSAQAELIQGKTKGSFESDILPYDERINFMKYEKPPVSLDHLQQSETYKLIHNMEQTPARRVEMLTPVIAEADYREKCRSVTPSSMNGHMTYPQQVHP